MKSAEGKPAAPATGAAPTDLVGKTARGAALVALSTWIVRLGYVAVYIMLARSLPIEEYGIVAAMTVVINLFGGMTTLGLQSALIQMPAEPSRDELDLAWTLDCLIMRSLAALAIGLSAFPIAAFFREPQLSLVVVVLALEPLIGAFENSSLVVLSRQLEFRRRSWLLVSNGMGFVLGTAALFLVTGSYWAPVAGALLGRVSRTAMSYALYPVAPRFRWQRSFVRRHLRFASGVFLVALFEKGRGQADKIVVGRLLGLADLGVYQFVSRLSTQLIREFTKPLRQVLFPTVARLAAAQDPERTRQAVVMIIEIYVLFGAMLAGFFGAHAAIVLELLVGAKWVPHAPVLQAMGALCVLLSANAALYPVLRGQGHATWEALMQGSALVLFVALALIAPVGHGMSAVLIALGIAESLQTALAVFLLVAILKVGLGRVARTMLLSLVIGLLPFWLAQYLVISAWPGKAGPLPALLSMALGGSLLLVSTYMLGRAGVMPGAHRLYERLVRRGRGKTMREPR